MPKSRRWGDGRPCLVFGGASVTRTSVVAALSDCGFLPEVTDSEGEAIAALEMRPFVAAIVTSRGASRPPQAVISEGARRRPAVPVLVLSASGTVQEAVDAMQAGASDYLGPPFQSDALIARLRRLLEPTASPVEPAAATAGSELPGLVGTSPPMRKLYSMVERVSRYKANVLLLGESGTGKELVARALHAKGPRRKRLFMPLNCATLGRDILENELFGHERGAFTGANERKRGLFELADGGTLFLDEISEIDPSTQAKLLRVLERNAFRRVGGSEKVKVDLSIIAATNLNLEEAIVAHRFRQDLYYRLKVVTIVVPPLRERKEDIPALVDAFIADFNRRHDEKIRGIAPQAMARLMGHDWPGNVRELKNAVESASVLATGDTIDLDSFADLPAGATTAREQRGSPDGRLRSEHRGSTIGVAATATLAEAERVIILEHLRRSGTRSATARSLGIGLRTLYAKLREYGVTPGS